MADQRLMDRISALIAKAESTEFEADAEGFMDKATQLMAEHAVSRSDLKQDEIEVRMIRPEEIFTSDDIAVMTSLLTGIAEIHGVFAYQLELAPGMITAVKLVGDSDSIDLCLSVFRLAQVQVNRILAAPDKPPESIDDVLSLLVNDDATRRRSVVLGFSLAFMDRLRESLKKAEDESPGVGLVLVSEFERAREKAEADADIDTRPVSEQIDSASFRKGQAAGNNADIGQTRIEDRGPKGLPS